MQAKPRGEVFAELFGQVLAESHTSIRRLSRLSGVSRRTLENWADGTVRRPRHWEPVLLVARALHLPATKTDALLLAAGQPSVASLVATYAHSPYAHLLTTWKSPDGESAKAGSSAPLYARIPLPPTQFVGREALLTQLETLLGRSDARLITVTGPGGVGKTRLVIEAARRAGNTFPDGIFFISLESANSSETFLDKLMADLAISRDPAISHLDTVLGFLGNKQMLLIMDTFENVLSSASLVSRLIQGAPNLRVIVTSRVVLRLGGEHVFALPPLADGPDSATPAVVARYEAVTLLLARVQTLRPDFVLTDSNTADVLAICRLVDGLPLALELAAAQTRVLSLRELRRQLEDGSGVLVGGLRDAAPRHQSIEETIVWSHDLLNDAEKLVFRRLSIYRDGCTLAAAQAVAAPDLLGGDRFIAALSGLLDHSLVQFQHSGGQRIYRMHALTRRFAAAQMTESAERNLTMTRLLTFLEGLADRVNRHIRDSERGYWLGQFDPEAHHVWPALEWGLATGQAGTVEQCLRICGLLRQYWNLRGQVDLGRKWTERALEAARGLALPNAVQLSALLNASALALIQADGRTSADRAATALRTAREIGDLRSVADALHLLGLVAYYRGDLVYAEDMWAEGLQVAEQLGNGSALALALDDLGNLASRLGDFDQALALHQREQEVSAAIGDLYSEFYAVLNLGDVSIRKNLLEDAEHYNRRALEISRELGDLRGLAHTLITQARLMRRMARLPEAGELLREALRLSWRIQNLDIVLTALEQLLLAEQVADTSTQIQLLGLIEKQRDRYGPSSYSEDESDIQSLTAALRQKVGAARFGQDWVAGQTLAWDAAVVLGSDATTTTVDGMFNVERLYPDSNRS